MPDYSNPANISKAMQQRILDEFARSRGIAQPRIPASLSPPASYNIPPSAPPPASLRAGIPAASMARSATSLNPLMLFLSTMLAPRELGNGELHSPAYMAEMNRPEGAREMEQMLTNLLARDRGPYSQYIGEIDGAPMRGIPINPNDF